MTYDYIIIGGGLFGCHIALLLSNYKKKILIVEAEEDLMKRATYNNQARVHNGYHYPRSFLTALRSHKNYQKFITEFNSAIQKNVTHLYAISRNFSNISALQFKNFMERIESPIKPASESHRMLFSDRNIEDVFEVDEAVFDADEVRRITECALLERDVQLVFGTKALKVTGSTDKFHVVHCRGTQGDFEVRARKVINCTYSNLNVLLRQSGLEQILLKHELAEIALVRVPQELQEIGITVMCGPFFSLMPFPARHCHSLTHVVYTPHVAWQEPQTSMSEHNRMSNFNRMARDATNFVPACQKLEYLESLWETKTVLPLSEINDSRPILFQRISGMNGLACVLGSKLDNVYDMTHEILEFENN